MESEDNRVPRTVDMLSEAAHGLTLEEEVARAERELYDRQALAKRGVRHKRTDPIRGRPSS